MDDYLQKTKWSLTTIYRKPSDPCNTLHYKSAHPKALKDSISYNQAMLMKRICSETSEVIKNLKDLKDAFDLKDQKDLSF